MIGNRYLLAWIEILSNFSSDWSSSTCNLFNDINITSPIFNVIIIQFGKHSLWNKRFWFFRVLIRIFDRIRKSSAWLRMCEHMLHNTKWITWGTGALFLFLLLKCSCTIFRYSRPEISPRRSWFSSESEWVFVEWRLNGFNFSTWLFFCKWMSPWYEFFNRNWFV